MTLPATPPPGYTTSELLVFRYDSVGVSWVPVIDARYVGGSMLATVDRTGIYAVTAGGLNTFHRFWVQTTTATHLWSGPDATARDFGEVAAGLRFVVIAPQSGTRLYVRDPRTANVAYLDAVSVGPVGPPSGT